MSVTAKDLETKKLNAIIKMREMAQSEMNKKGLTGDQLRKMVGIKRYER